MRGEKKRVESGCNDKMIINEIMLRYRPIAPRPVTVESQVGFVPVKQIKRAKRKYVLKKKNKKIVTDECNLTVNDNNNNISMMGMSQEFGTDPVRKVSVLSAPDWICFDVSEEKKNNNIIKRSVTSSQPMVDLHEADLSMTVRREELLESWVYVESVIGTCEDARGMRYMDEDIWKDLETESCPGFVSNGYDEVKWVNQAYKRMLDPSGDCGEVIVWLGVKVEKCVFEYWPAFSCRVRVVYVLSGKKKQMTVPCDVWKMDAGGYAWRLDVKAALSLGRLD